MFCFDEKTQIQALGPHPTVAADDPGPGRTLTHDYKRNGTIDLFAALNVATGEIVHDLARTVTPAAMCLVLQMARRPRARRPRRARHLGQPVRPQRPNQYANGSPTQPNTLAPALHTDLVIMAEPRRVLVLGPYPQTTHQQRVQLRQRTTHAIDTWIEGWNENPTPFIWKKTADEILASSPPRPSLTTNRWNYSRDRPLGVVAATLGVEAARCRGDSSRSRRPG